MPVFVPLHLGTLHPVEQVLTLLLAFGPFVVLAIVIVVRRRSEHAEADAPADHAEAPSDAPYDAPADAPSDHQADR